MTQILLDALCAHETLRIENESWHLGDVSISCDEVDDAWMWIANATQVHPTQQPRIKRVIVMDDSHYESLPFLPGLPRLEELTLYGVTLIDDLSALAGHPSLRRVAFTNYCGLWKPEHFEVFETLSALEEVIFFGGYLDLYDFGWSERLLGQLRSLWVTWPMFTRLNVAALTGMERLTVESEGDVFSPEELEGAELDAHFGALRMAPNSTLRLFHDSERRVLIESMLSGWVSSPGLLLEHHWEDAGATSLQTLNLGDAFLDGRPVFVPRSSGTP